MITVLDNGELRDITPGKYRHFKGDSYEVIDIVQHSETGEHFVIYKAIYGTEKIYARPLAKFASKIDHEKYPNIKQKYRFEKI